MSLPGITTTEETTSSTMSFRSILICGCRHPAVRASGPPLDAGEWCHSYPRERLGATRHRSDTT
eukprot:scaffold28352_cov34-Tisochrysis_lutea.AAC.3